MARDWTNSPPVYLAAVSTSIPQIEEVVEPPVRGTGIVSVSQASDPSYVLAVRAAEILMYETGIDASAIDRLLYSSSFDPTPPFWPPASYAAARLGLACPALRVDQVSNSGMAALHLAVQLLRSPSPEAILLLTGERHAAANVDRWRSDPGTVYGDGGTAALVTVNYGVAEILSIYTVSDPWLEGLHRPVHESDHFERVDLGAHKSRFLREQGQAQVLKHLADGQARAITETLNLADVAISDVDWFVVPHLGIRRLEASILSPFNIPLARTTWQWGRTVGHLGPGDQFFGLDRLLRSGLAPAGSLVLLISVGAGFSWTCALLKVCPQ